MPSPPPADALLIHITGHDAPGLIAEISRILAAHNAVILDVGQALVHETLSLGFLVEAPTDNSFPALRTAITQRTHELGLQVRFTNIAPDALQHWLHGLRQHRFIITMLGRGLTAEQLSRVSAIIAAHGMNVHRIERLS